MINHRTFSVVVKGLRNEVSWKIFPQFSGSLMGVLEHLKLLIHRYMPEGLYLRVFGDEPGNSLKLVNISFIVPASVHALVDRPRSPSH